MIAAAAAGCWRAVLPLSTSNTYTKSTSTSTSLFCCKAAAHGKDQLPDSSSELRPRRSDNKKVVVVGSGWAGLGAAHHLSKQGFDVTILEGGYELGPKNKSLLTPDGAAIRGFLYPFRNIFNLVDELGIKPFTSWTKSAQYSQDGLEVEYPIFQESPQLPTPFGTLFNTRFVRLPFIDQLTSLPLMAAVINFDNTDTAWRKYDPITAREMLRQFGCSDTLYRNVLDPLLQVGLFAPAEQFGERIFKPWIENLKSQGCKFLEGRKVTDVALNEETGCITEIICEKESFKADAMVLAVGISTLQEIVQNSAVLCAREEFLKTLNLNSIDLLTVKLVFDQKVNIPYPSNVSSGFDESYAWSFFDLSTLYDEYKDSSSTVIQADFYHANELLPLKDDKIVEKVMSWLSKCIKGFENATVIDKEIGRYPKFLTHYFPGSYKYMMRGSTSFPNLYMAGDWIVNRHGSWSQEKSYISGLEAANRVVDYLEEGTFAKIIPVEEDEPHIESLRELNRSLNDIRAQLPFGNYFMQ